MTCYMEISCYNEERLARVNNIIWRVKEHFLSHSGNFVHVKWTFCVSMFFCVHQGEVQLWPIVSCYHVLFILPVIQNTNVKASMYLGNRWIYLLSWEDIRGKNHYLIWLFTTRKKKFLIFKHVNKRKNNCAR